MRGLAADGGLCVPDELPRIDTPNATIYVQDYGVFRIAADDETHQRLVDIIRPHLADVLSRYH